MQMGLMMDTPLTVTSILRHAMKFHAGSQIVSRTANGDIFRYTYADFAQRVHQLAHALTRLGVKPGDRVATLAWNGFRHLEIYYAVSCLGAICHTINPRLFHDQIVYIINHAEDNILFFDLNFADQVEGVVSDCPRIHAFVALCSSDEMPDARIASLYDYEGLIAKEDSDFTWPLLNERTASALCYTSGTTGNPKGVLYDHRSTVIHALGVSGGDWLAIRERDSILPVVPMFHANAWGIPYAALMNGAKLVLPGHAMDGASLHDLIEAEGVTMMAGVPTVWLELLRHLRENGLRLDGVERMMVGGSAAPYSMIKAFEETYDVRVIHGWGMTELSPVGTLGALKGREASLPAEERYSIQAKQGRPLFGVDLRIVDADGDPLPHDGASTGMLQVQGFWVASGYFKNDSSDSFDADGWFSTGDVASIDGEGYLRITDRTKDVIKSGGEWISSIELENIAVAHPAIAQAACIAIPHDKWGERPLLVVVAQPGATAEPSEILNFYRGKVADWWIPDHVEVVEELPLTATGKLSKLTLRDRFKGYRVPKEAGCPS